MATFFGGSGTGAPISVAANFVYFFPATCTLTGNVTDGQINIAGSASGNCKLAVYADSGGFPAAKLGESGVISVSTTGWLTTTYGTPFAVTNGVQYWLAWLFSAGPTVGAVGTGSYGFLNSTYPTFPGTGGAMTGASGQTGAVQAGVTAGGGGGATFVPQTIIIS